LSVDCDFSARRRQGCEKGGTHLLIDSREAQQYLAPRYCVAWSTNRILEVLTGAAAQEWSSIAGPCRQDELD